MEYKEYVDDPWPKHDLLQADPTQREDISFSLSPAGLMPKRTPRLIDRIARLWSRNQPDMGPQRRQQETTQSGVVVQALQSVYDQYFRSQSDRLAIYKDVDEMDAAAEEGSVALDTIADNVTTSEDGQQRGFRIVTQDQKVSDILEKVIVNCGLQDEVYSIARNSVKYGDMFLEIVVNNEGEIVQAKQLPPSTMFRNQDPKGNLLLGKPRYDEVSGACLNIQRECAYEQRAEDTQTIVATFYPWQIVHGRFNHDGFSPYGRSLLRVSRIIWKKLKAEDEGLIMGRLVRAMLKLIFYVDTTGQTPQQKLTTLQQFKSSVQTRAALDGQRENPFYVLTDFFLADGHYRVGGDVKPSRTRVELLDPKNEGLNQIVDVKYFHRKLLATLRVPPAHMGFEEQINAKSTLTQQDVQYVRFLRRTQSFVSRCLQQIFDTALLLQGIDPKDTEYDIKWPLISAADEAAAAQAQLHRAQAHAIYLGQSQQNMQPVISAEWVRRSGFGMAEEDSALELSRMEDEHDQQLEFNQQENDQAFENSARLIETQAKTAAQYSANPKIPGGSAKNALTGKGDAPQKVSPPIAKKPTPKQPAEPSTPKRSVSQDIDTTIHTISPEARVLSNYLKDELDKTLELDLENIENQQQDNLKTIQNLSEALKNLFPR